MTRAPVILSPSERRYIEEVCPSICARGGWDHHVAAAGPDHVHVLVTAPSDGKVVRRLLKRWLTQTLNTHWPNRCAEWWTECGSVKWIWNEAYFRNAFNYISRQRTDELLG